MHIKFPEGLRPAILVLALVGVSAVASAQDTSAAMRDSGIRDTTGRNVGVLRSGDVVRIVVFREKDLTGEFLIDSRGDLQIPGLGVIRAAGLGPTQLRESLRASLQAHGFTDPEISVQPLVRVSVLGEVRAPALYPVDPGISLIQLLTIAGGPTPNANLSKTRVVREGRVFEVDLQSALGGSAAGRVVLYSNDVVVVPRKTGLTRENLSILLGLTTTALSVATFVVANRRR